MDKAPLPALALLRVPVLVPGLAPALVLALVLAPLPAAAEARPGVRLAELPLAPRAPGPLPLTPAVGVAVEGFASDVEPALGDVVLEPVSSAAPQADTATKLDRRRNGCSALRDMPPTFDVRERATCDRRPAATYE